MPRALRILEHITLDPEPVSEVFGDGVLTVREAVAFSRIPRNRLFDLMLDGTLPWSRPGKARLICKASLVRYLKRFEGV